MKQTRTCTYTHAHTHPHVHTTSEGELESPKNRASLHKSATKADFSESLNSFFGFAVNFLTVKRKLHLNEKNRNEWFVMKAVPQLWPMDRLIYSPTLVEGVKSTYSQI